MDEAKDSINCIQVTDHEILTASVDGRIRCYDLRNGEMISDYIGSKIIKIKTVSDSYFSNLPVQYRASCKYMR
jgi:WD40 repeat protein